MQPGLEQQNLTIRIDLIKILIGLILFRGVLSNQKSVHTTHTTRTTRLQCLSSHAFYDVVERVVHRVNAPRAPPNECEPWREVGGSSQIN